MRRFSHDFSVNVILSLHYVSNAETN